jgi:hypothetical protein
MLATVPMAVPGYVFRNVASGPFCSPDTWKATDFT